jgi:nucleoside permease NupC
VKAGLAICAIGGQRGSGAPMVLNLWPSLMAFCPVTHMVNGILGIMCCALQTAVHCADSWSLIAWPTRAVVFGVSSLADWSAGQVSGCAIAFLVSCLHSAVLRQVLGIFMPM